MQSRPAIDEFVSKLIETPGQWDYVYCAHPGDTLSAVARRLVAAGAGRFQVDVAEAHRVGFCVVV